MKSRILKVNKNFKPSAEDGGDELFYNGIFVFNVTKLLVFIKTNPHKFSIESMDVKVLVNGIPEHLNEETIKTANPSIPIVLAEISPGRFNVIDGNHRLEKARREGLENIEAFRVGVEQHLAFLTSVEAYQSYVKYWNSKLKEK